MLISPVTVTVPPTVKLPPADIVSAAVIISLSSFDLPVPVKKNAPFCELLESATENPFDRKAVSEYKKLEITDI